jgi:rhodanese-related sulfurtransferase
MRGQASTISAQELYSHLGTAAAPVVVDARKRDAFDTDDRLIVGAVRYDPDASAGWPKNLPAARSVVVYCVHGGEVSQTAASQLQRAGINAAYLDGGMTVWQAQNLPTRKKITVPTDKWVTRERPKLDRIADVFMEAIRWGNAIKLYDQYSHEA